MSRYGADPKLPFGSNYCKCPACGEYFTNDRAFSMHRKDGVCRNPAEVVDKHGAAKLVLNPRGYWGRPGRGS